MQQERRYPIGLKLTVAGAILGVLLALAGAVGFVVSVAGLFATADGAMDRIRPQLVGEAALPAALELDLRAGDHAVYVIAEDGVLPARDRSVRLDVRITGPDGEAIRFEGIEQPPTYDDPRSRAQLGWVGDFTAPRPGRYLVEAQERPGAHPVDRLGVGENPGFGEGMVPWIAGIFVAFFAGAGGMTAAIGLGIGAAVWASSLSRSRRAPGW